MRTRYAFHVLSAIMILVILLTGLATVSSAGPSEPAQAVTTPSGRVTSIVPPPPQVVEQMQQEGRSLPDLQSYKLSPSPVQPRPLQGNLNLLAILVDFTGTPGTVTNLTVLDNLVFAPPVSTRGSVRDYYDEVTRSNITLVTVNPVNTTGWRASGNTMAFFGAGQYGMGPTFPQNAGGMVAAVLPALDPLIDFSNYDNDGDGEVDTMVVIHAGTGAEWSLNPNHIWSHASAISWMGGSPPTFDGVLVDHYVTVPEYWEPSLVGPSTTDMTVGVICHEIAHGLFGVVDLYDLDVSSLGIGSWGLMSYGDWNGPAKYNSFLGYNVTDGSSPAWPMAWTRLVMGIDTAPLVWWSQSGVLLPPVETTANAAIRLKSDVLAAQEYFLLENRQRITNGYDEWLPSSGLLIWHVDEMQWSIYAGPNNDWECLSFPPNHHCWGFCTSTHYLVSLEQADGQDHLEHNTNYGDTGDPFPGSSGNTAWQPYLTNPVNPESGSWYDSACGTSSCIDITNIHLDTSTPKNAILDINQAACSQDEADLGDAPASWNNYGDTPMTAYFPMPPLPMVQAWFPTVYYYPGSSPHPPGPLHHFCQVDAWLGPPVYPTGEFNADWPPDQDGQTNIIPTNDVADMDSIVGPRGYDDGLVLPVPLAPCNTTSLQYTATVTTQAPYGFPMPRFVNAWFDWNRDGDWGDTISCPGGTQAPEWAVQDEVVSLGPGLHYLSTLPFVASVVIAENTPFEIWMRLSIADMPAAAPGDGRGPFDGYDLGETEDYLLHLFPNLYVTADPPGSVPPGAQIMYHIQNNPVGNVLGVGAVVSDVLPMGIEYVTSIPPGTYDPGSRTVTWNTPIIPGQLDNIDLIVDVTGTPGQVITNTAYLLWGDTLWARAPYVFQIACAPDDPHAEFVWSVPACAGNPVSFTNLSTGTLPIAYAWDLDGDGDTDSTEEHPTWTYGTPGSYTVTLTATNACSQSLVSYPVPVEQPVQGVVIAGPASLLVDQVGFYTATLSPPDAESPWVLWDNGDSTLTTTRSWDTAGQYTLVVTAGNDCGTVVDTFDVLVSGSCISLTGVNIAGPASLQVGEEGIFSASPQPPTATNPIYLWSNGDIGDNTVYSWTVPGTYDVEVTASNCQGVAVSNTVSVLVTNECVSLTAVTIAGPSSLQVGEEGTFNVTPKPPTATNPAYLWSNGLSGSSTTYSWPVAGNYTVTVTGTNCTNVVVQDHFPVVVRDEFRIYLPVVLRAAP